MAVVSFIQRLTDAAFDIGMKGARNFGATATTRLWRGKSLAKRGRGYADAFKFHNTREAAQEYFVDRTKDSMKILTDPNRSLLRKGVAATAMPVRMTLGAAHAALAAATDVAGMGAATVGTVAGLGISAPALAIGVAAKVSAPVVKAGLKGGWKVAKFTGMTPFGVAKATGMAGGRLAGDVGATVAGTGKFLWNTRKDPIVGSALMVGAIGLGAVLGSGDYRDKQIYGSMYGGKPPGSYGEAYNTHRGYFNPVIQAPAWQLTKTYSPGMDKLQEQVYRGAANDNALEESIDPLYGPMGHDLGQGATGDLVFALHALRNGGQL